MLKWGGLPCLSGAPPLSSTNQPGSGQWPWVNYLDSPAWECELGASDAEMKGCWGSFHGSCSGPGMAAAQRGGWGGGCLGLVGCRDGMSTGNNVQGWQCPEKTIPWPYWAVSSPPIFLGLLSSFFSTLWASKLHPMNSLFFNEIAWVECTPFLDVYPTEMCTYIHQKKCARMFIEALIIITQNWKPPKCPKWMDNQIVV